MLAPPLAADKENLKTQVAQQLLDVREKEMTFYAKNLSMVGTHAALLAGFAFTILSQYKFKAPEGGVISRSAQAREPPHRLTALTASPPHRLTCCLTCCLYLRPLLAAST